MLDLSAEVLQIMAFKVGLVGIRVVEYVKPCLTGQQTCILCHSMLDWSANLYITSNHVGLVSKLVDYVMLCWTGQQNCCRLWHTMLAWSADLL